MTASIQVPLLLAQARALRCTGMACDRRPEADNDDCVVDARSVLGLLGMGAGSGSRLRFEASGKKATKAVQAVEHNFAGAFSFNDL